MTTQHAIFLASIDEETAQIRHDELVARVLNKAARLLENDIQILHQAGFLVPGLRAALANSAQKIRALKVAR